LRNFKILFFNVRIIVRIKVLDRRSKKRGCLERVWLVWRQLKIKFKQLLDQSFTPECSSNSVKFSIKANQETKIGPNRKFLIKQYLRQDIIKPIILWFWRNQPEYLIILDLWTYHLIWLKACLCLKNIRSQGEGVSKCLNFVAAKIERFFEN